MLSLDDLEAVDKFAVTKKYCIAFFYSFHLQVKFKTM